MHRNIRLASYPPKGKESETMMLQITILLNRIIICLMFIILMLINNNNLCALRIKLGTNEMEAVMACES